MESSLVVISWWSNCLALRCLETIFRYTDRKRIFLVQCGKAEKQKKKMRAHLDPRVIEIPYPSGLPAEHYHVLEYLVGGPLGDEEGVWFHDHDAFFTTDTGDFYSKLDCQLAKNGTVLFVPDGRTMTNPAFWISPRQLPRDCPSFSPVPTKTSATAQRPDLTPGSEIPETPHRDTLVNAYIFLEQHGLAALFPEAYFPEHAHLGGLHVLAWDENILQTMQKKNPDFAIDLGRIIRNLQFFYDRCPGNWLASEEPTLLKQLKSLNSGK